MSMCPLGYHPINLFHGLVAVRLTRKVTPLADRLTHKVTPLALASAGPGNRICC
jgi:hypothetical protein